MSSSVISGKYISCSLAGTLHNIIEGDHNEKSIDRPTTTFTLTRTGTSRYNLLHKMNRSSEGLLFVNGRRARVRQFDIGNVEINVFNERRSLQHQRVHSQIRYLQSRNVIDNQTMYLGTYLYEYEYEAQFQ